MTDKNKEALEALEQLMSVLCDPQGNASIRGSHGDLMIIDDSLRTIRAALTQNEVTDDEVREAVKYIRKFTNDPSYITTSFIKHLETLITAATRKPEKEWQPIETAPRDGSYFWAYQSKFCQYLCRWAKRFSPEHYEGDGAPGWYAEGFDTRGNPTHWKPIDAPKVKE